MNAIQVEVIINQTADYLSVLNDEVHSQEQTLVVIEDNIVAKRHSIFQKLTAIDAPVLIVNKKPWRNPIKVLAAVDPIHENASTGRVDTHIVSYTEQLAALLKAKWSVVHCCNITWPLAKYKTKILAAHRNGLTFFAKKQRITLDKCILLEGMPETALTAHIIEQNSNILVIGLIARNKLEQLWIGSTTTALLTDLPCDMLLIKK
ncbi:universal stress protein [Psychromonas sp. RZ22]|uniref:universal stress protein n=1 Tax=Psychromonas algarum TaxID=2555643 RepID=UPI001067E444|nr:universal stress protein [Psychromonas sp. RZ22]TEW54675.1 universal stress protein [Psychromonas sp. RZ22]